MTSPRSIVPGSYRRPAVSGAALDPATPIEATVVLRRRAPLPQALVVGPEALDPAEFAARYGAADADIDLVTSVLAAAGLTIGAVDPASRRIQVSGDAAAIEAAFGTTLTGTTHRHRAGELSVPTELDGVVVAVLGIDDRPQARAHFRIAHAATDTSFTPVQLGAVYGFPAGTDGTGQTLAIVELGGGYADAELENYFTDLGVATPSVRAVGVDGGRNVAGKDPQGADGEVLLDIEVAGALAPGASIVVYFAPNTDRGFLDAVATAVHAIPTPAAVSISWGQSEDEWTAQARTAMDDAFADAAALGVTVCVAAGDDGSTDRATDGDVHVDFPAASPHVLACGGTSLVLDRSDAVQTEKVWNNGVGQGATGGGVSDTFARPDWQDLAGVPMRVGGGTGRGVPDVAGDADPGTGYQVLVDGERLVIGGTSAVSPLWAALVCRLTESLGRRLGLLQPMLYAAASAGVVPPGFRDIVTGTNGAYAAGPGWDACTGLGVPDGEVLLAFLQQPAAPVDPPAAPVDPPAEPPVDPPADPAPGPLPSPPPQVERA